MTFVLGLDAGGSKTLAAAASADGAILRRRRIGRRPAVFRHATFVLGDADGVAMTALFTIRPQLARGEIIHLCAHPDKQQVFDTASGRRIG